MRSSGGEQSAPSVPPQEAVERAFEQPAGAVAQDELVGSDGDRLVAQAAQQGEVRSLAPRMAAQVAGLGEQHARGPQGRLRRPQPQDEVGGVTGSPAGAADEVDAREPSPAARQRRGDRDPEALHLRGRDPNVGAPAREACPVAVVAAHATFVDEPRVGGQQRARRRVRNRPQLGARPEQNRLSGVGRHGRPRHVATREAAGQRPMSDRRPDAARGGTAA